MQALGNHLYAELLLALEGFGDDGHALGFLRQSPPLLISYHSKQVK